MGRNKAKLTRKHNADDINRGLNNSWRVPTKETHWRSFWKNAASPASTSCCRSSQGWCLTPPIYPESNKWWLSTEWTQNKSDKPETEPASTGIFRKRGEKIISRQQTPGFCRLFTGKRCKTCRQLVRWASQLENRAFGLACKWSYSIINLPAINNSSQGSLTQNA